MTNDFPESKSLLPNSQRRKKIILILFVTKSTSSRNLQSTISIFKKCVKIESVITTFPVTETLDIFFLVNTFWMKSSEDITF